jgi:hypothetical protein
MFSLEATWVYTQWLQGQRKIVTVLSFVVWRLTRCSIRPSNFVVSTGQVCSCIWILTQQLYQIFYSPQTSWFVEFSTALSSTWHGLEESNIPDVLNNLATKKQVNEVGNFYSSDSVPSVTNSDIQETEKKILGDMTVKRVRFRKQ